VFDAIRDALDVASPGGACGVAIAGEPQCGLATLRLGAARTARLAGYVPVAPRVLRAHPVLATTLAHRHVCLLTGDESEDEETIADVLSRLGSSSTRRHVVLSFGRRLDRRQRPSVHVEPMGITAMTGMVFVDREDGPQPDQLFEAARRADGRPGRFLAHLGAYIPREASAGVMVVHETAHPYMETAREQPRRELPPAQRRTAGALSRAADRGDALARAGRHASARRVLTRAHRVLSARGDRLGAATCLLRLGWLALDRAGLEAAVEYFEKARDLSQDGATSVAASIGLGIAWTDAGQLLESEAALRTSALAARTLDDPVLTTRAAAGLGRCLYWQGRYDEAAAALRGVADLCGPTAEAAWAASTLARVHVAEGSVPAAMRAARHGVDLAVVAGDPRALASAYCVMAAAAAAAGDPSSAARHVEDGLRVARRAHLPLAGLRLRLTALDIATAAVPSVGIRRQAARLAAASSHWPRLLQFHARAVRSRVEGAELDRETRAFIEASGAVALARASGALNINPVADLETLLDLGQTASDDRTAIDRICTELIARLRAATIIVVGPNPERRTLALCGRPWRGEPHIAWRALASGFGVAPDASVEPCQSAEPVRYSGEIIGSVAASWTAGAILNAARASALLRVGALAIAANVRALLDRSVPECSATHWDDILGESVAARSLRTAIARAARAPFPVLIEGESGSGKELVARAIHRLGPRRDRRFCAINCAALSDDLLEAELFGHARGAFTGAVGERAGLFEDADGGTLFLDEIGELSGRAQAKLLRVLQDGEVRRVGENVSRRVDVRIVAATNRRLEQEAAAGRFRADLRFRLDVVRIDVPPLRDRATDVPLLASSFWNDAAARMGLRATLSPEALAALARYDWPGNVRELQNVIAWMAVHSPRRGRIGATALPMHVARAAAPSGSTFESARADFERRFVKAALATADGQRTRAAEALGVTRQGLAKMLRRLGLEAEGK
jgi:DNA-binding NtrC family response regulator/tetratricopeptide (TPR) repeat protein